MPFVLQPAGATSSGDSSSYDPLKDTTSVVLITIAVVFTGLILAVLYLTRSSASPATSSSPSPLSSSFGFDGSDGLSTGMSASRGVPSLSNAVYESSPHGDYFDVEEGVDV
jgi:hypothetical protein